MPDQRQTPPPAGGAPPPEPTGGPPKGPADGRPVVPGAQASGIGEALERALRDAQAPGETEPPAAPPARKATTKVQRRTTPRAVRVLPPGLLEGAAVQTAGQPRLPQVTGMRLATKYILLISSLVIVVCLAYGIVVCSILSTQLREEILRYGKGRVLWLRILGREVYADFKNPRIGQSDTAAYQRSAAGQQALKSLAELAQADDRIRDLTIFASNQPTDHPYGAVLSTRTATGYTRPPDIEPDQDGVLVWEGQYRYEGGQEGALFFRCPVAGQGKALYATANLVLSLKSIHDEINATRNRIILFGLIFVGIGIGLSLFLASHVTRPIEALVQDMEVVSQGNLEHETIPRSNDEIGLLAVTFNRMTENVRVGQEREREVSRLNSELNLAKEIHAKLMPEKLPTLPGLDISTAYSCAKEVGGDYFDFFVVSAQQGLVGIVVADVSGKGIPGSMVMGTTRTILRMMAFDNPSPADVLIKTNSFVTRDIRRGMFVTMVYGIYNIRTRNLVLASAGHNPTIVWRAGTRRHELCRPNGIALGFDPGPVFERTIQEARVPLSPGDRLVFYSDGVVECMNEQREEWGEERFCKFTEANAERSSQEFVRLLNQALEQHQGAAEQHDDITVVTFRIVS